MLEAGLRAPSGDNCQPWRFVITDNEQIEIYLVPARTVSFFDYEFRASFLSVGAVCKNMHIAAAIHGFSIRVDYFDATTANEYLTARISIRPVQQSPDMELYQAMLKRTVNRRPYLPLPLRQATWDRLLCDVPHSNVDVLSYKSGKQRTLVNRLIQLADTIRWTHPQIHSELFDKIRYNKKEIENTRDGLEIKRLGIGPLARNIMQLLSSWPRMTKLNQYGMSNVLAWQSRMLAISSSAIIGVWIRQDTSIEWMHGGEAVENIWCRAQQLGLAVQPVPVALYLHRRLQSEGTLNFHQQHIDTLQAMDRIIQSLRPGTDSTGLMLFRIGRAWNMHSLAVRKELEDLLS